MVIDDEIAGLITIPARCFRKIVSHIYYSLASFVDAARPIDKLDPTVITLVAKIVAIFSRLNGIISSFLVADLSVLSVIVDSSINRAGLG